MTGSTKTAISLSSQALTIPRGQGGSHPPSAVRDGPNTKDGPQLMQQYSPVDK